MRAATTTSWDARATTITIVPPDAVRGQSDERHGFRRHGGSAHDPHARRRRLTVLYRGLDIERERLRRADHGAAAEQLLRLRVGTGGPALPGRYLFDDKSKMPSITTYAQLQFVKAEAAFRKGDKATALTAYRNGISAHIDFVNARNLDNGQVADADQRGGEERRSSPIRTSCRRIRRSSRLTHDHDAEVHRSVGLGTQRGVDGHAPVSTTRTRIRPRASRSISVSPRRRTLYVGQLRQDRASASARVTTPTMCGTAPAWTSSVASPRTITRSMPWIIPTVITAHDSIWNHGAAQRRHARRLLV